MLLPPYIKSLGEPQTPITQQSQNSPTMAPLLSSTQILIFPFMAQGHTIPLLDLSKMFSHRGIKVTIITTPANAPSILQTISQNPKTHHSIHIKQLHFPLIDVLPKGCENTDQLPSLDLYIPFLLATKKLQQPFEDFLQELNNKGEKPNLIISDFFLGWTKVSASKFEIPRLVFNGMGAFAICVTKSLRVHSPHMHVKSETEPFQVLGMPNNLYLTKAEVPAFIKNLNEDNPLWQFIMEIERSEQESWGVIINSFMELELDYMNCLDSFYSKGASSWYVGPVCLCNKLQGEKLQRGRVVIESHVSACMEWLDEKRTPGSVIYVSFGTQAEVPEVQLDEIAYGLEESGVGFVWVLRSSSWCFPNGFEERVKGRGLVIREWAPQLLVLSHKAVGGFLSHCGWNSVMESISAGVPILAWPMIAEQVINAKFVVEELKAGLGLPGVMLGSDKIVDSGAVLHGVRELMVGEKGKKVRERARELGEAAKIAIEEGGSSHVSLDSLVDQLCNPISF